MNGRRGQSIAEYLLIFAVVAAAIMTMQVYAKRGIQGVVKTAADQMSPVAGDANGRAAQLLGIRQESGDTQQKIVSGRVLEKSSEITTMTNQTRTMDDGVGGSHTRDEQEITQSSGTSTSHVISQVK